MVITQEGVNPLQEGVDEFLVSLATGNQNTAKAYRNDLGQLVEDLKVTGWTEVTLEFIQIHITRFSQKGYLSSTQARKVASIKSFFGFLLENDIIKEDPTESLGSPRVNRELSNFLSEEGVSVLLNTAYESRTNEGKRDAVMLEVLYATGLLVGELVGLNIEDIDLRNPCIYCRGKGSKNRRVYLYPMALEALRRYITTVRVKLVDKRSEESALFVNHRGERLTRQWVWKVLQTCKEKAGMDEEVTPHTLRHSLAVHLLQKGASLRHVQELLGHSNISTTKRYYARYIPKDRLREAYEKIGPRA